MKTEPFALGFVKLGPNLAFIEKFGPILVFLKTLGPQLVFNENLGPILVFNFILGPFLSFPPTSVQFDSPYYKLMYNKLVRRQPSLALLLSTMRSLILLNRFIVSLFSIFVY